MLTKTEAAKKKYSMKTAIFAKNIIDVIGTIPPKEDEYISIVTQRKVNRHAFTEWAIKTHGKIDEMYITTYRMGENAARLISDYIKSGKIGRVSCIISDNYKTLHGQNAAVIENIVSETPKFNVYPKNNHSKITAIRCGDHKYVITGSGNYSENAKIEEYQLVKSSALYDFHTGWINGET